MKQCSTCGAEFDAKRNQKRCPACRGVQGDGPGPDVKVRGAVEVQLAAIGKADSPLGATALVLASRLDAGADPGSAMAAMAKELRSTMSELLRAAPAVADPVDELRARRKKRLGA